MKRTTKAIIIIAVIAYLSALVSVVVDNISTKTIPEIIIDGSRTSTVTLGTAPARVAELRVTDHDAALLYCNILRLRIVADDTVASPRLTVPEQFEAYVRMEPEGDTLKLSFVSPDGNDAGVHVNGDLVMYLPVIPVSIINRMTKETVLEGAVADTMSFAGASKLMLTDCDVNSLSVRAKDRFFNPSVALCDNSHVGSLIVSGANSWLTLDADSTSAIGNLTLESVKGLKIGAGSRIDDIRHKASGGKSQLTIETEGDFRAGLNLYH